MALATPDQESSQFVAQAAGYRASIYIEEYSLSNGIRAGDAIIAATAVEQNLVLTTANTKQFKIIRELQLALFKP